MKIALPLLRQPNPERCGASVHDVAWSPQIRSCIADRGSHLCQLTLESGPKLPEIRPRAGPGVPGL